jgi:hypothetical protein
VIIRLLFSRWVSVGRKLGKLDWLSMSWGSEGDRYEVERVVPLIPPVGEYNQRNVSVNETVNDA